MTPTKLKEELLKYVSTFEIEISVLGQKVGNCLFKAYLN